MNQRNKEILCFQLEWVTVFSRAFQNRPNLTFPNSLQTFKLFFCFFTVFWDDIEVAGAYSSYIQKPGTSRFNHTRTGLIIKLPTCNCEAAQGHKILNVIYHENIYRITLLICKSSLNLKCSENPIAYSFSAI